MYGHSAVQICGWTKKALTNEESSCYKQKFYGIDCHSCMEFSPAVMWCQQNCTFCWRPMEFMKNIEINPEEVDNFKDIVDTLLEERKKLLSGFRSSKTLNTKKFDEAQVPSHFAISLSGEPTMYPHLDKIIEYLKSFPKTKSIFLVTNAQIPEFFEKLLETPKALPTQLYISIDAPSKEHFKKINLSLYEDGWERLQRSLEYFSKIQTRKIFRMTQIKGTNDKEEDLEGYKTLVEKGKPDFIEVKAYMHIGMSQGRHKKEEMPEFLEVKEFAQKLANYLGNYNFVHEAPASRICLLQRKDTPYQVKIEQFENEKVLPKKD